MREVELPVDGEPVSRAQAERGGRPFADAVHGEDGRLPERRGKERAGGMAQVVLREEQARVPLVAGPEGAELALEQRLLEELLAKPEWNGHRERAHPPRGKREVCLEQALELEEGFVVEGHEVDLLQR